MPSDPGLDVNTGEHTQEPWGRGGSCCSVAVGAGPSGTGAEGRGQQRACLLWDYPAAVWGCGGPFKLDRGGEWSAGLVMVVAGM